MSGKDIKNRGKFLAADERLAGTELRSDCYKQNRLSLGIDGSRAAANMSALAVAVAPVCVVMTTAVT